MADMPWREAIIEVLRRRGAAMHYATIAEGVVAEGLRKAVGATPASTVSAVITTSLNTEGDKSPFQRVARGEYILRSVAAGAPVPSSVPAPDEPSEEEADELEGPVFAFGMFWDRSRVRWTQSPAVLGKQQIGADAVDMGAQRGIYLLHDVRDVIYVGRCTDRALGTRLYEHTFDRLRTRWNRFSWFGVCPINDDGSLGSPSNGNTALQFIAAMEALLIEALEPPQNRRRGDGFTAVEFIQADDPEVERAQLKAAIVELQSRL
jgi:hypothetical protein